MSLRLVEAIIPEARTDNLDEVLKDCQILGLWISPANDRLVVARILTPTGSTEAVSDALSEYFGHFADFRIMLFAVEATMPLPEDSTEEEEAETQDAADSDEDDEAQNQQAEATRISREELYQDISQGAQLTVVYFVTVILSTIVAAIGLLRDSVAVVVGAMVIAPLLGPNVALALASTLGDIRLVRRSLATLLVGIAATLVLAVGIGAMVLDVQSDEILSRTKINSGDLLLALAAGSAGALAFTTGIPSGVIGVMVAVALLPPLVVAGLLVGAGEFALASGAFVLFVSNVACVNLAGVVTFLVQKVRPRLWWEAETAERATRIALGLWITTVGLLLAIIFLTG